MQPWRALAILVRAIITLGSLAVPCHAINKCTDPRGSITYQEEPCPGSAKAGKFESWDVQKPATQTRPPDSVESLRERAIGLESERKARDYDHQLRRIALEIDQLKQKIDDYRRKKEEELANISRDSTERHPLIRQPGNESIVTIAYYDDLIRAANMKIVSLQDDAARISAERQ